MSSVKLNIHHCCRSCSQARDYNELSLGTILTEAFQLFRQLTIGNFSKFVDIICPYINNKIIHIVYTVINQIPLEVESLAEMTVPEIIEHHGYTCETHQVTTKDGYILRMHRIPYGKANKSKLSKKRKTIFLQHGLFCSSAVWVLKGPDNGLGFLLADRGYDVWMGNFRGNKYSKSHKDRSPKTAAFWDFNLEEFGSFDLPAMIDYVLSVTTAATHESMLLKTDFPHKTQLSTANRSKPKPSGSSLLKSDLSESNVLIAGTSRSDVFYLKTGFTFLLEKLPHNSCAKKLDLSKTELIKMDVSIESVLKLFLLEQKFQIKQWNQNMSKGKLLKEMPKLDKSKKIMWNCDLAQTIELLSKYLSKINMSLIVDENLFKNEPINEDTLKVVLSTTKQLNELLKVVKEHLQNIQDFPMKIHSLKQIQQLPKTEPSNQNPSFQKTDLSNFDISNPKNRPFEKGYLRSKNVPQDHPKIEAKGLESKVGESDQQLCYIGHSMGTMAFLIMCSTKPEYNRKISKGICLAPAAYLSNIKSPICSLAINVRTVFYLTLKLLGFQEVFSNSVITSKLGGYLFKQSSPLHPIYKYVVFQLCGFNEAQFDGDWIGRICGHVPDGAGLKQMYHLGQIASSGRFCRYDHGKFHNLRIYGHQGPQIYDLRKVSAPVYLLYGENDYCTHEDDVMRLTNELPNLRLCKKVDDENWNHQDFVFGKQAKQLVYGTVLDIVSEQ